ncbi:hypothetical protein ACFDHY_04045 [Staphylococcus hyicus]|uniref:hypothetical protein n=1 Tax=Staphylococcus hyicus TaxID=1284 RepID=UPI0036D2E403
MNIEKKIEKIISESLNHKSFEHKDSIVLEMVSFEKNGSLFERISKADYLSRKMIGIQKLVKEAQQNGENDNFTRRRGNICR